MHITFFKSMKKATEGKVFNYRSFKDLGGELRKLECKIELPADASDEERQEAKKSVVGFVACELTLDERSKCHRKSDKAGYKDFLCFDLDEVNMSFTEFKEYLQKNIKCSFFAYTTASHTEEKPKLRMLVPLSSAVDLLKWSNEQHAHAHEKTADELGLTPFLDKKTNDKARLYFVPTSFSGGCEYVENFDAEPFPAEKYEAFAHAAEPSTFADLPTAEELPTEPTEPADQARAADPAKILSQTPPTKGRIPKEKRIFNEMFPDVRLVLNRLDEFKQISENRYVYEKSTSKEAGIAVYDSGRSAYSFHGANCELSTNHKLTSFDIIESLFLWQNGKSEYKTKDRPSFRSAISYASRLFPEFKDRLEQARQKRERFSYENFCDFLDAHGIELYYDVIKMRMRLKSSEFSEEMSLDARAIKLLEMIKNSDYNTNKQELCDFLELYAQQNRRNAILDMIDAEPWDGHDYLADFHRMTKNSDEFEQKLFKLWIWQALSLQGNTLEHPRPSCGLLLFVGEKAFGKSYICSRLALRQEYFASGSLDLRRADSIIQSVSVFVKELNELDSTLKRSDFNELKAFLTQSQDRFRKPYARFDEQIPRRTSFCGTVNPEDAESLFAEKDRRYWFYHIAERINAEEIGKFNFLGMFRQIRQEQRENPKGYIPTAEDYEKIIAISKEHLKRENGEEEFLSILVARGTQKDLLGDYEKYCAAWMTTGDFLRTEGRELRLSSPTFKRICTKNDIAEKRTKQARLKLLICRESELNEFTQHETDEMRRMRIIADKLREDKRIPTASAIAEKLRELEKLEELERGKKASLPSPSQSVMDYEKTMKLPPMPTMPNQQTPPIQPTRYEPTAEDLERLKNLDDGCMDWSDSLGHADPAELRIEISEKLSKLEYSVLYDQARAGARDYLTSNDVQKLKSINSHLDYFVDRLA